MSKLINERNLCFDGATEKRYKAVTRQGTIISKSGFITGGLSSSDRSRALRWDEKHFSELKRLQTQLEHEQDELLASRRRGTNSSKERLDMVEANLADQHRRISFAEKEIVDNQERIRDVEAAIAAINKRLDEEVSEVDKVKIQFKFEKGVEQT